MKKTLIFISILLLATSLFAVDALKVELDLTKNPIFLCGIANGATEVPNTGFTYDNAIALSANSIASLVLSSNEANPDETVAGSFYIWWYVYSPNAYKINIWFDHLKGTTNTALTIPFEITTAGSSIFESQDSAAVANKSTFMSLAATTTLNKGHQQVTVPSFSLTDLTIDKYSTDIHIEIVSNT